MSDVYYNQVMHPLVSGYFETLTEVREVLEENRLELKDVSPEHREWRLVKSYLDEGGLAARFHRLRYVHEDEDGPVERWAFSLARLSPAEWCTTTRPETVGVSLPE